MLFHDVLFDYSGYSGSDGWILGVDLDRLWRRISAAQIKRKIFVEKFIDILIA